MFFALKGENFNGNKFAMESLEKGASAAIVDEDIAGGSDTRIIRVENVLESLQNLASHYRKQLGIPVLAITGSNGKTTTKELCKAVLSRKYTVQATEGNLNNHIGVPLTLLSIQPECNMAIVEMGANHPGEIDALCHIADPDYGLITNIGKAHLEGFGGIEGVARAKGELFRYLMENSKTIFLNGGNEWLTGQVPADYPKTIRYNMAGGLQAAQTSTDPYLSITLNNDNSTSIQTRLAGGYNTENVLAAFTVGLHFGIPVDQIKEAIEGYEPVNNRSQIIKTSRNTVFMDAYNANPSSMAAAIEEFLKVGSSGKMIILGEMREVGNNSEAEHFEIAGYLKNYGVSRVYLVGSAFEKSARQAGFQYAPSVDQLIEMLKENLPEGYFILVKGSRSNRLEKILPYL